jgi:probable addiction module antidote protein
MAAYLEPFIEEANGEASFITKALCGIAWAQGMTQPARASGLSRESLYKALSGDRSPSFFTILKGVPALGFKFSAGV